MVQWSAEAGRSRWPQKRQHGDRTCWQVVAQVAERCWSPRDVIRPLLQAIQDRFFHMDSSELFEDRTRPLLFGLGSTSRAHRASHRPSGFRLQQLSSGAINVPDKNDERRLSKQARTRNMSGRHGEGGVMRSAPKTGHDMHLFCRSPVNLI